jgi:hypothetical protein
MMKKTVILFCTLCFLSNLYLLSQKKVHTVVSIKDDQFFINGKPTYAKRYWNGYKIEGLLLNSRMVQGIFDDLNPETKNNWIYPDTKKWDPERNTNEFVLNRVAVLRVTHQLSHGTIHRTLKTDRSDPNTCSVLRKF